MAPAAFINPAVIQRTAQLVAANAGTSAAEPFRYREGIVLRGSPATFPFRYAVAGVLSGTQAALGAMTRARAPVRQRIAGAMRAVFPSSGFGPSGDLVIPQQAVGPGDLGQRVEVDDSGGDAHRGHAGEQVAGGEDDQWAGWAS